MSEHWSDCAVNNAPAYEPGPCNCGGYMPEDVRTSAPVSIGDEDIVTQDWLHDAIEGLSALRPMHSCDAYTHRRTLHVAFGNGAVHKEGAETVWWNTSPRKCAEATFEAVRAYRDTIEGPVGLVWRKEPEVKRSSAGVSVYLRLCFEPCLVQVASGVWVEERLNKGAA